MLEKQINLKDETDKFVFNLYLYAMLINIDNYINHASHLNDFNKPKSQNKKEEKALTYESADKLLKGSQKGINGFESKRFPIKKTAHGIGLKILTPTQIIQRLPIALAQAKACNSFENLFKGTVMQIEKSLINDRLRVSRIF